MFFLKILWYQKECVNVWGAQRKFENFEFFETAISWILWQCWITPRASKIIILFKKSRIYALKLSINWAFQCITKNSKPVSFFMNLTYFWISVHQLAVNFENETMAFRSQKNLVFSSVQLFKHCLLLFFLLCAADSLEFVCISLSSLFLYFVVVVQK